MEFVVEHFYNSGCWDSHGHETVRNRRYKCIDHDIAQGRVNRLTTDRNTIKVRVFAVLDGRPNLVGVYGPRSSDSSEYRLPRDPVRVKTGSSQSTLF